jgi:acyl-CoA synthetase (NDP forming)
MEMLPGNVTENLLRKYRIPFPERVLARSEEAAAKAAQKMGFPVVMKIASPDIIHKTDAKCVIVRIRNSGEAIAAYLQILKNARKHKPRAKVKGVWISRMIPDGTLEVIIGSKHDPQFGPVLMFGLGGILVEILRDVAFRIIPLERIDAKEMVREIRGFRVLEGVRGQKPVNLRLLESTIMKVSKMVWENTGKGRKIQELDINPLFISEKDVWAADVRILV